MNELHTFKEVLFIQQYIKNAKKKNQSSYAMLLENKLDGNTLAIQTVTKSLLVSLYIEEKLTDKEIAFLFDCTFHEVKRQRSELGIGEDADIMRQSIPFMGFIHRPKGLQNYV